MKSDWISPSLGLLQKEEEGDELTTGTGTGAGAGAAAAAAAAAAALTE